MHTVRIRPLKDVDELSAGVDLQKQTWGPRFDDVVSAALMLVAQKIGGIAAGAFDESGVDEAGELIAMIFGLTGIRHDRRTHWSHMLAVVPEHQGQGLGRLLKAYQRERVRRLGIETMYWTFDPLEARNAHFNINVLGVDFDEYVADMYGSGESSPLHRGIGTDRFVVRWNLSAAGSPSLESAARRLDWEDEQATARIPLDSRGESGRGGLAAGPSPERAGHAAHQQPEHAGLNARRSPANAALDPHQSPERVEIPPDIQRLKASDPERAAAWRTATRAAFTRYLSDGRTPTGFTRDPETGACFYLFDDEGSSTAANDDQA